MTFLSWGKSVPRLSQSLPDPLRCHVNSAVWGLGPASPPLKLGQRRANCWEEDCSTTGKVFIDFALEVNRAPEHVCKKD